MTDRKPSLTAQISAVQRAHDALSYPPRKLTPGQRLLEQRDLAAAVESLRELAERTMGAAEAIKRLEGFSSV